MKDQFLGIEVRLLVLRYGRPAVLAALARDSGRTVSQLEQELFALEQKAPSTRTARTHQPLLDVVSSVGGDRPEILEVLRELAVSYQNRVFLPSLRDVHRFLDRLGVNDVAAKSRAAAGPAVIRALAKLQPEQIRDIAAKEHPHRESDYAVLSRAIMGTPPTRPSDSGLGR